MLLPLLACGKTTEDSDPRHGTLPSIPATLLITLPTGRALAYEVLNVDNAISNLIREGQLQQLYSVIQTGRSRGMVTMNESLQRLYNEGIVDASVALQRSPRPKELARLINVQA